MKALALRSALSARASEGAVKIVDGFDWESPKTKRAAALLEAIGTAQGAGGSGPVRGDRGPLLP
jgi:ribosomal protein L4